VSDNPPFPSVQIAHSSKSLFCFVSDVYARHNLDVGERRGGGFFQKEVVGQGKGIQKVSCRQDVYKKMTPYVKRDILKQYHCSLCGSP